MVVLSDTFVVFLLTKKASFLIGNKKKTSQD